MTGFLDTEIAPNKPTPQNKGQNVDTKSRLNGRDLRYANSVHMYILQFFETISCFQHQVFRLIHHTFCTYASDCPNASIN